MSINLSKYKTWFFDCDGVLLDSNKIKTKTFHDIAKPFGESYANLLVAYHKKNGGISRYEKIKYFFENILKSDYNQEKIQKTISNYGLLVKQKLIECPETECVREFLEKLPVYTKKYVVSGSSEEELKDIFRERRLDKYFDCIYGSPSSKKKIFENICKSDIQISPAIFVGDSLYDYQMSKKFKLDFVFMTQYTEFNNWGTYFSKSKKIIIIRNLKSLLTNFK